MAIRNRNPSTHKRPLYKTFFLQSNNFDYDLTIIRKFRDPRMKSTFLALRLTGAIRKILHVRGEALDDRIFVGLFRQALIDFVSEPLHDQFELLIGQDEVFAGISYLRTYTNEQPVIDPRRCYWVTLRCPSATRALQTRCITFLFSTRILHTEKLRVRSIVSLSIRCQCRHQN